MKSPKRQQTRLIRNATLAYTHDMIEFQFKVMTWISIQIHFESALARLHQAFSLFQIHSGLVV